MPAPSSPFVSSVLKQRPASPGRVRKADIKVEKQHRYDWLRRHGCTIPAPPLSAAQRAEIEDCFSLLDSDGSGMIDMAELTGAFSELGISINKADVQALLGEMGGQLNTGEIDYEAFSCLMGHALNLDKQGNTATRMQAKEEEEKIKPSKRGQIGFTDAVRAYRRKKLMHHVEAGADRRQQVVEKYKQRRSVMLEEMERLRRKIKEQEALQRQQKKRALLARSSSQSGLLRSASSMRRVKLRERLNEITSSYVADVPVPVPAARLSTSISLHASGDPMPTAFGGGSGDVSSDRDGGSSGDDESGPDDDGPHRVRSALSFRFSLGDVLVMSPQDSLQSHASEPLDALVSAGVPARLTRNGKLQVKWDALGPLDAHQKRLLHSALMEKVRHASNHSLGSAPRAQTARPAGGPYSTQHTSSLQSPNAPSPCPASSCSAQQKSKAPTSSTNRTAPQQLSVDMAASISTAHRSIHTHPTSSSGMSSLVLAAQDGDNVISVADKVLLAVDTYFENMQQRVDAKDARALVQQKRSLMCSPPCRPNDPFMALAVQTQSRLNTPTPRPGSPGNPDSRPTSRSGGFTPIQGSRPSSRTSYSPSAPPSHRMMLNTPNRPQSPATMAQSPLHPCRTQSARPSPSPHPHRTYTPAAEPSPPKLANNTSPPLVPSPHPNASLWPKLPEAQQSTFPPSLPVQHLSVDGRQLPDARASPRVTSPLSDTDTLQTGIALGTTTSSPLATLDEREQPAKCPIMQMQSKVKQDVQHAMDKRNQTPLSHSVPIAASVQRGALHIAVTNQRSDGAPLSPISPNTCDTAHVEPFNITTMQLEPQKRQARRAASPTRPASPSLCSSGPKQDVRLHSNCVVSQEWAASLRAEMYSPTPAGVSVWGRATPEGKYMRPDRPGSAVWAGNSVILPGMVSEKKRRLPRSTPPDIAMVLISLKQQVHIGTASKTWSPADRIPRAMQPILQMKSKIKG